METCEVSKNLTGLRGMPMPPNDKPSKTDDARLIQVRQLVKVYDSPAGDFLALKSIDLEINRGEFVGLVGKSGCGKSTLINMLSGIDRPTSGEIWIGDAPLHSFDENQIAAWRGRSLGIVFQYFQLLPTLTLLQNIVLPMELNGLYKPSERRARAMRLLEMVEVAEHAHKLPAGVSGGQQQRVAIARALANDPPILLADEPTGNLDSKTATKIFDLFEELAGKGKTIVVVTHDDDLAKRVNRTIILSDGKIVSEYVGQTLPALSPDQLELVVGIARQKTFPPAANIVAQGQVGDNFYVLLRGEVEVFIERTEGKQVLVNRLHAGQYFGEAALLKQGLQTATFRAAASTEAVVAEVDAAGFNDLLGKAPVLQKEFWQVLDRRMIQRQILALAKADLATIKDLTRGLPIRTYKPGEDIFRQGALGDTFFVILEGAADVICTRPDDTEIVLSHLESGKYFGELALLGNRRRDATARAVGQTPTQVVELDRSMLEQILKGSDLFEIDMYKLMEERLANQGQPAKERA
jgi:ABC-type lipoprotein export system ATPase subunit/CRP-like cAMP-binding protein